MSLFEYDDKCVRIALNDGSVFEGACVHNSDEYCETEFGVKEESLEIAGWLFYKSEIAKIELITDSNPYSSPFGIIEEEALKDYGYAFEDTLLDGDPRNAERLLNCLEHHINQNDLDSITDKTAVAEVLKSAMIYAPTDNLKERCRKILSVIK